MRLPDVRGVARGFFSDARPYLLFLLASAAVGVVFGIVGGIGVGNALDGESLATYVLDWYVGVRLGFGGFLARFLVEYLIGLALVLLCNLTVWLLWANYFWLIVRGYLLGCNVVLLIYGIGAGGVFCALFVFVPQQLLILAATVILSAYANRRCRTNRGFSFRGAEYDVLLWRAWRTFLLYFALATIFSAVFGLVMTRMIF